MKHHRSCAPSRRLVAGLLYLALASAAQGQAVSENALIVLGDYRIGSTAFRTGCTPEQVGRLVFSDPSGLSVRQAFREASNGAYTLNGQVHPQVLMVDATDLDTLAPGAALSCNSYSTLSQRMGAQLRAGGVDPASYDRRIFVMPFSAGCSLTAGAILGQTNLAGNDHWIFGCDNGMVYEHEIGHDLLGTASHCASDDADPMNGRNGSVRLFNAAGALALGWLGGTAVSRVEADTTYVIAPLERADLAGPRAYLLTTSGGEYVLSYRQPIGVDANLGPASHLTGLRVNERYGDRNLRAVIAPGQSRLIDDVQLTTLSSSAQNLAFSADVPGTVPPIVQQPPAAQCTPSPTSLCLAGGRLRVSVSFLYGTQQAAQGQAYSDQTGLFSFFSPDNTEVVVKVVDGRPVNNHFWAFWGGLTDIEYTLTITDVATGKQESWRKPAGSVCGGSDTELGSAGGLHPPGAELDASSATTSRAPCQADGDTLCLLGGAVQVDVGYGRGQRVSSAVALSDKSGVFSFFDSANVELAVKVIDGRTPDGKGRFWLFTGGLSDVDYQVRFTSTATGNQVILENPAGNLCGAAVTDLLW